MAKTFKEYIQDFGQSSLFSFDSTTGQIIPLTSNVLSAIKSLMNDIFDKKLNLAEESPAGRLCEAWAASVVRFCSVTADYANQINPDYATGQMLDAIGSVFNVIRAGKTVMVISISCTGIAGTSIPSGSIIKDKAGNKFETQSRIIIESNGIGLGSAISIETGLKEVKTGDVNEIVSSVVGWETVTNTGIITPYADIESDASLRSRIRKARWTGTAFVSAIISEIERVHGVTSCVCIENAEDSTTYLNSQKEIVTAKPSTGKYLTLNPHSVLIIAIGSFDQNAVANAILKTKSVGCGYTTLDAQAQGEEKGTVVKTLLSIENDSSGIMYPVYYNLPKQISFGVNIKVRKNKYSDDVFALEEKIKSAIVSWANGEVPFVDGIEIGQSIYSYEIGAAVSDVIPTIQIMDVSLSVLSDNSTATSIDVFINELAVLDESKLTVTIVE